MSGNVGQERDLAALMRAAQAGDRRAYSALLFALLPLLREAVRHRFPFLQPTTSTISFKIFFSPCTQVAPPTIPIVPSCPGWVPLLETAWRTAHAGMPAARPTKWQPSSP